VTEPEKSQSWFELLDEMQTKLAGLGLDQVSNMNSINYYNAVLVLAVITQQHFEAVHAQHCALKPQLCTTAATALQLFIACKPQLCTTTATTMLL
jgi:hypothetical protein